jgi:hypothetical protein
MTILTEILITIICVGIIAGTCAIIIIIIKIIMTPTALTVWQIVESIIVCSTRIIAATNISILIVRTSQNRTYVITAAGCVLESSTDILMDISIIWACWRKNFLMIRTSKRNKRILNTYIII